MIRRLLLSAVLLLGTASALDVRPQAGRQATSGESTATGLTELVSAPTNGNSIYITSISVTSSVISTASNYFQLKSGTGTNCGTGTSGVLWGAMTIAFDGKNISFPTPYKVGPNLALCWIHAAAGTKVVAITYYLAP